MLGIIYFIIDPSTCAFMPRCPVRLITGLPCPGCGSQRAIHALLHLDFKEAFHQNFLMCALIPVIFTLSVAEMLREKYPRFYNIVNNQYVAYALLVIILGWWILRIIFEW